MNRLRLHSEEMYREELDELRIDDTRHRPANWQLSPHAVLTYLIGGRLKNGFEITPKYIGNKRLMEIAIATLTTDRALLLYGVPGTGKSWVSEHLTAAISGDSKLLIQGTAGTSEDAIRYGWNYAQLLAKGPSEEALVETPIMKGMREGRIVRFEELTRVPAEVQDTLITILSEKSMPIPELSAQIEAVEGFNLIATANNRDKGVNELSSALKRRFNTVVLPTPATQREELDIIRRRVASTSRALDLPLEESSLAQIEKIVTIFRELRHGLTTDGKAKLKSPSGTLSTAEAISVVNQGLSLSAHFGDGVLSSDDISASLIGAIVKDPVEDKTVFTEYMESVMKKRPEFRDIYLACKELV